MKSGLLLVLIGIPVLTFSQIANPSDKIQIFRPGAVVEEVIKDAPADKAGLQEGDVVRVWIRGDMTGKIESPFDLSLLEIEQAPRGSISLKGWRGAKESVWTLDPGGDWGFKTRPNFPEGPSSSYVDGRKLAQAGKWVEAAEHWRMATSRLDESTPLWVRVWLLSQAAGAFTNGSQWKEADDTYQQTLQQAGEALPAIKCLILEAWANSYSQRKDLPSAEKYYRQSIAESQKQGSENLITAVNYDDLGTMARNQGDMASAEQSFSQALQIRQKLAPGSLAVASSLDNLGSVAWKQGDLAKAEKYLDQALELIQKVAPGSFELAGNFSNHAIIASQRGELAKAEGYYLQVLDTIQKLEPGGPGIAATLNNLGIIALQRGDLSKADGYLHQAVQLKQKLHPGTIGIATSLINLGNVALQRNDLAKAEEYYRQALEIFEKVDPEALGVATSLSNLGLVAIEKGDVTKAEEYQLRALQIRQKLAPGSFEVAGSFNNLGEVAEKKGDLAKAEEYYRQAQSIWQNAGSEIVDYAESLAALAGILRRKEQSGQAAQYYQQAVDILEKQMAVLGGSEESRSAFRSNHLDIYRAYIDLLVRQKQPELAFHVLEHSRAQGLLETLVGAHLDIHNGVDPVLSQQEHSLQDAIRDKFEGRIHLLSSTHTDEQLRGIEREINDLLTQYQDVKGRIRSSSPAYAALTQPQSLNVRQVQPLLDDDTVLLEYSLGEEKSYVFEVASGSFAAYELPRRLDIETAARRVYESLTARDTIHANALGSGAKRRASGPQAAALSRMILGPVAGQIKGKRLIVVSDGILGYIPFAALPIPKASDEAAGIGSSVPLIVEHEIVSLPSASTLVELRRQAQGRQEAPKVVAVLADPVFDKKDERVPRANSAKRGSSTLRAVPGIAPIASLGPNPLLTRSMTDVHLRAGKVFYLPRLPFTRREASKIISLTPSGMAMAALDFDANRATMLGPELAKYKIVHIATHGLVDSVNPGLSGLVFSLVDDRGKEQDGFLGLQDIYNLNLNADLVVLSACRTGLGKEVAGEGLVGMTRGFMYAGANRVLASLWNVEDAASAELMASVYQALEKDKLTPAAALRQAQIQMWKRKRWSDPYYWAGFQLQGDWK